METVQPPTSRGQQGGARAVRVHLARPQVVDTNVNTGQAAVRDHRIATNIVRIANSVVCILIRMTQRRPDESCSRHPRSHGVPGPSGVVGAPMRCCVVLGHSLWSGAWVLDLVGPEPCRRSRAVVGLGAGHHRVRTFSLCPSVE